MNTNSETILTGRVNTMEVVHTMHPLAGMGTSPNNHQPQVNIVVASSPLLPCLSPADVVYYQTVDCAVPVRRSFFPRPLYGLSAAQNSDRIKISSSMRTPDFSTLKHFISPVETQHLLGLAEQGLAELSARQRCGQGFFLRLGQTAEVAKIEARIARLTATQVQQGEGFYLHKLPPGQGVAAHYDYFDASRAYASQYTQEQCGGHRVASLVIFLNDIDAGGETEFPVLRVRVSSIAGNAWYCAYWGTPDGQQLMLDQRVLYAQQPPRQGAQWLAVKFIRQKAISQTTEIGYDLLCQ